MAPRSFLPWICCFAASSAITICTSGASGANAGEIVWRVENNFRLLKNPADQEWIKNIATESRRPESASFSINDVRNKWNSVPLTFFDATSGIYEPGYVTPKKWAIRLSFSSSPYGTQCEWLIDYKSHRGPCHDFVPALEVSEGPTQVSVHSPSGIRATTQIKIKDVLFAVLGDSYISGEGTPDVFQDGQKRKAQWWDQKCHRSLYAWPVLLAGRYAADNPQQSVTLISRACSGAVINDVNNINNTLSKGVEKNVRAGGSIELRPQIAQLSKDLCQGNWQDSKNGDGKCIGNRRYPDYLLLSIGGNDAKFADVVVHALLRRINQGIELKSGKQRGSPLDNLFNRLLGMDKKITNYQTEALNTVKVLEELYPKMAERIHESFPSTPVLMALYPDPLHREANSLCGRSISGKLEKRDDGIATTDFTMYGIEEVLANVLKRRITNEEVVAIHDDFYLRLTGRVPLPLSGTDINDPNYEKLSKFNRSYRGLLSIGITMEGMYPGLWHLIRTNKLYAAGESPWDVPNKGSRDTDQLPGYRTRGYCVAGSTAIGRWFNTINDSFEQQGNLNGAMHPNIYGQLFYASKAYDDLASLMKIKIAAPTRSCLSNAEQEKRRNDLILPHDIKVSKLRDDIFRRVEALADRYGEYDLALKKFSLSKRFTGDRARFSQPYSDPGRKEWGSDQWGRKASIEYAEIEEYNQALSAWRAAIQEYEYAYNNRLNDMKLFDEKFTRCLVQR